MTQTTDSRKRDRAQDGTYQADGHRMCVCGHKRDDHCAERVKVDGRYFQDCMAHDVNPTVTEICECQAFTRSRTKVV